MLFQKSIIFQGFKLSIFTANNTLYFFYFNHLEFIENVLVLFFHSFYICLEKIIWYTLTNFYLLTKGQ